MKNVIRYLQDEWEQVSWQRCPEAANDLAEIVNEAIAAQKELEELRKRLEWQPMETCPMGNVLFRDETRVYKGYRHRLWETHVIYDNHEIDLREKFTGWMPLPEVE